MYVCERCLEAIESHEGPQVQLRVDPYDICDENDMVKCEWCEEEMWVGDCDEMYEI